MGRDISGDRSWSILDRLDADECREVDDVAVPVELSEVLDIAALIDVPVVSRSTAGTCATAKTPAPAAIAVNPVDLAADSPPEVVRRLARRFVT